MSRGQESGKDGGPLTSYDTLAVSLRTAASWCWRRELTPKTGGSIQKAESWPPWWVTPGPACQRQLDECAAVGVSTRVQAHVCVRAHAPVRLGVWGLCVDFPTTGSNAVGQPDLTVTHFGRCHPLPGTTEWGVSDREGWLFGHPELRGKWIAKNFRCQPLILRESVRMTLRNS